MWQYVLRRFGEGFITLIALSFVVFGSVHLTGDPADYLMPLTEAHDQKIYEAQKKQMGLDRPFIVQYWDYINSAVLFDFGTSFVIQKPISELILTKLPATVHLALCGFFLSIVIGIPLGIMSAVKRDSIFDKLGKGFAVFGLAAPQFWVAIMLILFLGGQLQWFPTYGRGDIQGWWPEWHQIPQTLWHLALPPTVLALSVTAAIMRLARSAMLEILDSDYVKVAQVKGLSNRIVIWRHAAKNALIPVLTFGGITLAGLLNGSVVVEVVFAWPGVGLLLLDGVTQRDFPLTEAAILLSGFFYITTAVIIDIAYGWVDPRVRTR